jgi:hypothetical protein
MPNCSNKKFQPNITDFATKKINVQTSPEGTTGPSSTQQETDKKIFDIKATSRFPPLPSSTSSVTSLKSNAQSTQFTTLAQDKDEDEDKDMVDPQREDSASQNHSTLEGQKGRSVLSYSQCDC